MWSWLWVHKIVLTGGLPAPQTPWRGAGSPPRPPAYREAPPLGLSVFSWYQDYWTCPNPCDKDFRILTCPNPCVKDFRILDLSKPLRQRFQNFGLLDFQVPRYLKSGLGRAGLGPWVGPWQCWPKLGPTQARFETSGNLEIQKFGVQQSKQMKILKI